FERLSTEFFDLDERTRLRVLEERSRPATVVGAYMAYLESEKLYYSGKKDDALSVVNWLQGSFSDQVEVMELVNAFVFRMENYAKMDARSIGVVLPLTGDKSDFGKRVLLGLDYALSEVNKSVGPEGRPFTLHFKDSEGGGALGAHRVRDLIEKNMVSV